jgi:hypothetical protein
MHGELITKQDGSVERNLKVCEDRLYDELVPDRVVDDSNVDQIAYLGLDRADMLNVMYHRPVAESESHPAETGWLTSAPWGMMSPKGAISKRLPKGMVMVNSERDLTRLAKTTDAHGKPIETKQLVRVRVVTKLPERHISYAVKPAGDKAKASLQKYADVQTEGMENFDDPDQIALYAAQAISFLTEINGIYAPILQKAGYVLNPATVTTLAALNGGETKKPKN